MFFSPWNADKARTVPNFGPEFATSFLREITKSELMGRTMSVNFSRRELFSIFRRSVKAAVPKQSLRVPLRPPGAVLETRFSDVCMQCGNCVAICPRQAIKPLSAEYGTKQGTPHIEPNEAPCVLCEGLLCSAVCPSGALKPIRRVTEVAMGLAAVDPSLCLSFRNETCSLCIDRCPIQGALKQDSMLRPVVGQTCVGCGLCEYYCPTETPAISVRPRSTFE